MIFPEQVKKRLLETKTLDQFKDILKKEGYGKIKTNDLEPEIGRHLGRIARPPFDPKDPYEGGYLRKKK